MFLVILPLSVLLQVNSQQQIVSSYTPVEFPTSVSQTSDFTLQTLLWSEDGSLVNCSSLSAGLSENSIDKIISASLICDSAALDSPIKPRSYECRKTTALFRLDVFFRSYPELSAPFFVRLS